MAERKFLMRQFFKRNDKLSKLHIFEVDKEGYTQVSLCGAKSRRPDYSTLRTSVTIDALLRIAPRRYKHYNNKQPCMRCLQKAEHIRHPLERLADV